MQRGPLSPCALTRIGHRGRQQAAKVPLRHHRQLAIAAAFIIAGQQACLAQCLHIPHQRHPRLRQPAPAHHHQQLLHSHHIALQLRLAQLRCKEGRHVRGASGSRGGGGRLPAQLFCSGTAARQVDWHSGPKKAFEENRTEHRPAL